MAQAETFGGGELLRGISSQEEWESKVPQISVVFFSGLAFCHKVSLVSTESDFCKDVKREKYT